MLGFHGQHRTFEGGIRMATQQAFEKRSVVYVICSFAVAFLIPLVLVPVSDAPSAEIGFVFGISAVVVASTGFNVRW